MSKYYKTYNYSNQSRTLFLTKVLAIVALLFGSASVANAQLNCSQTATVSGQDCSNPTATISNLNCQGAGAVISATLDATIGSVCTSWYSYDIIVNGTTIATDQCNQTGFNLTPYLPITSVAIQGHDNDNWCDPITLNLTVNVSYVNTPCSGTPNGGTTNASADLACSGDMIMLTMSGQTMALGLSYQWQSSSDGITWTDMVGDTNISASTTMGNSDMYYRCEITCNNSGSSAFSTPDTVNLGTCASSGQVCNTTNGSGVSMLSISGWVGVPTSMAVVTFDYEGDLGWSLETLTVTDYAGNVLAVLQGASSDCQVAQDTIMIPPADLAAMLSAGNGNIELTVTATSYVNNICSGNSFCIDASIIGLSYLYADDAGVGAITSPALYACILDSTVNIVLQNNGSDTLTSCNLGWSVNGTLQAANSWTGSIPPLTSDTVQVGVYSSGFNDFDTLTVWTYMPNGSVDSNVFGDTSMVVLHGALNGVYTIDPSGNGDFISFSDAIGSLELYGVCGPVTFEAVDTTYVEQLSLTTYQGVSSTNTVTFTSQSGDPTGVVLAYSSTSTADNFVVEFVNSAFIEFRDITIRALGTSYGRVIVTPTSGGSHHITIDGCILDGITATSAWSSSYYLTYIYGPDNDYWTITNNEFHLGNYGLYLYGNWNISCVGNVVSGNEFYDQYYRSVYVWYQNNLTCSDNYVTSSANYTSGYAFYFGRVKGGSIDGNYIEGNSTWPRYGMFFSTVEGDLSQFMPVINNRVYMPYSSSGYGMYVSSNLFVEFAHNSVLLGGSSFGRTWYMTSGGYNKVKNNIIQNIGTGYGMYFGSGTPVYQMDYNNLSADSGMIGYASGAPQSTIADWQLATMFDSNSLSVSNVFSDTVSLKVCTDSLYGMGVFLADYPMDFEGDMRQDPPCIGADEFMPIALFGGADDPVICDGDTLTLRQDFYDTVVWNSIDTSNVFQVYGPGTIYLDVYDACGSASDTINVLSQMFANIGDTNLCEGTSAVLETGISNGQYMWSNGSTDSTVTVDSAQTIVVTVIDAYGCTSMDTAVITQSYDVNLGDSTTFCEGANVVLDANLPGTYVWSDGSSNQTLSVSAPGTYSVTVTDQNCVSDDDIIVTEILNVVPSFTDSSDHYTVVFTNTSQNATSYLWDFGDGHTSTDEHPTHVYPWSTAPVDYYTVTLTAYNSCGDDQVKNDSVRAGELVSVSELDLASMISVYPNPNIGLFNVVVAADEAKELTVEVIDARGALVYNRNFGTINGEIIREIRLENTSSGIYFVRVILSGETAVYRISIH